MTRRILILILFIFMPVLAKAQGQQITVGPFSTAGLVYVCPVPSGGTPCPSPSNIFSDSGLTRLLSNPFSMPTQTIVTFYAVGGQYTIEMPASGTQQIVGGGGGSSTAGQFSVKTYGAVGDTRASQHCSTSASATVTNPDNPWVASDVGKFFEDINAAQGTDVFTPARKIAAFVNAGQITIDQVNDGTGTPSSGQNCKWFTKDDTAAFLAAGVAARTATGFQPRNQSPTLGYPGTVYCPPGGYTVSGTIFIDNPATPSLGIGLSGDRGGSHCVIYPTATFNGTVDSVCSGAKEGLIYTCQTERTSVENIEIENHGIALANTAVGSTQGWVMLRNCNVCTVKNVLATDISLASAAVLYLLSYSGVAENNFIQNSGGGTDFATACEIQNSTSLLFSNNLCSNHVQSLIIAASGTRGSGASQLTLVNEATDECGSAGGTLPCTQIQGSVVNYIGGSSFGGVPELMSVDGTSAVYLSKHNLQQFGSSAANIPGILEVAGSLVVADGSTLGSNGNSPIVSGPSTATFVDEGGNTYQNCLSGACAAITAANYTTKGFSGGIIPKSTQTHTPNTCYAVTGNLLATAQNLCILLLDQNYQVLNITAQSGGTTPAASSCTGAPVITLSDGTRTATLTMTTGKTAWSSAVDVSTVNTVFASGATLTVSIGANTCVTPPSNVSVNYVLQSAVNP